MDELHLYDDLDDFQMLQEKKSKEFQKIEERYQESLNTIVELKEENQKLTKNIERMKLGFQSLLDTARSEIKRKDKEIERLRRQKDDICFRRKVPRNTANSIDNFHLLRNTDVPNVLRRSRMEGNENSFKKSAAIPPKTVGNNNEETLINRRNRSQKDKIDNSNLCKRQLVSRICHGNRENFSGDNHNATAQRNYYKRNCSPEYTENRQNESMNVMSSKSMSDEKYYKNNRRSKSWEQGKTDTCNDFERKQSVKRKNTCTNECKKSSSKSSSDRTNFHADNISEHNESLNMSNGKLHNIFDNDLGEDKYKNISAKFSQQDINENFINNKKKTKPIDVDILNQEAKNEETQKNHSAIFNNFQKNESSKIYGNACKNTSTIEMTSVKSSTIETSTNCTPFKVTLDRNEINNCFIHNRKADQNINTVGSADMTKDVADDIGIESGFTQIPCFDSFSHSREFSALNNTSPSIKIDKNCKSSDYKIRNENTLILLPSNEKRTVNTNNTKFGEIISIDNYDTLKKKQNMNKFSVTNAHKSVASDKIKLFDKGLADEMNTKSEMKCNNCQLENEKKSLNTRKIASTIEVLSIKENSLQSKEHSCRDIESNENLINFMQAQHKSDSKITPTTNSFELIEDVRNISDNINKVLVIQPLNSVGCVPLKNPYNSEQDKNAHKHANKATKSDEPLIKPDLETNGTNPNVIDPHDSGIDNKSISNKKANESNEARKSLTSLTILDNQTDTQNEKKNVLLFAEMSYDTTANKTAFARGNLAIKSNCNVYLDEQIMVQSEEKINSSKESQNSKKKYANENNVVQIRGKDLSEKLIFGKEQFCKIKSCANKGLMKAKLNNEEILHDIIDGVKLVAPAKTTSITEYQSFSTEETLSKGTLEGALEQANLSENSERIKSGNDKKLIEISEIVSTQKTGAQTEKQNLLRPILLESAASASKISTRDAQYFKGTCSDEPKSLSNENLDEIVKSDELFYQTEDMQMVYQSVSSTEQGTLSNLPEIASTDTYINILQKTILPITRREFSLKSSELPVGDDQSIKVVSSGERKSMKKDMLSSKEYAKMADESILPMISSQEEKPINKFGEILQFVELCRQKTVAHTEKDALLSNTLKASITDSSKILTGVICPEEIKTKKNNEIGEYSEILPYMNVVQVDAECLSSATKHGLSRKLSEISFQEEHSLKSENLVKISHSVKLPKHLKIPQIEKKQQETSINSTETVVQVNCSKEKASIDEKKLEEIAEVKDFRIEKVHKLTTSIYETAPNLTILLGDDDQVSKIIEENDITVRTVNVKLPTEVIANIERSQPLLSCLLYTENIDEVAPIKQRNLSPFAGGMSVASFSEIRHNVNKIVKNNLERKTCNNKETSSKITFTEDSKNRYSSLKSCHSPPHEGATQDDVIVDYNESKTKLNVKSLLENITKWGLNDDAVLKANEDLATANMADKHSKEQSNSTSAANKLTTNNATKHTTVIQVEIKLNERKTNCAASDPQLESDSKLGIQNDMTTYKQIAVLKFPDDSAPKYYENKVDTQMNDKRHQTIKSTEVISSLISSQLTETDPDESVELQEKRIVELEVANKKKSANITQVLAEEMTHERNSITKEDITNIDSLNIGQNRMSAISLKPTQIKDAFISTTFHRKNLPESTALREGVSKELKIVEVQTAQKNGNDITLHNQIKKYNFSKKLIMKEINMEGEIVEVLKNIVCSNELQTVSKNTEKFHQTSQISCNEKRSLLEVHEKAKKFITERPENNSGSFYKETLQNKVGISDAEFRDVVKINKQIPSIAIDTSDDSNVYIINKEIQNVCQCQESQSQTIETGNEDILPLGPPVLSETYHAIPILPSISATVPPPSNFSGIFSKKISSIVTNDDDLIKFKKKSTHFSGKPKEFILPAASVLCNVDNLKNATKSKHKMHWELLDNKNEMTEIEDDADIDTTDEEKIKIKEQHFETASTCSNQSILNKNRNNYKLEKSPASKTHNQTEYDSLSNDVRRQKEILKKLKKSKIQKFIQRKRKLPIIVKTRINTGKRSDESLLHNSMSIEKPFVIPTVKRHVGRPRKQNDSVASNNIKITHHRKKRERIDNNFEKSITLNSALDNYKERRLEDEKVKKMNLNNLLLQSFNIQSSHSDAKNGERHIIFSKSLKPDKCTEKNSKSLDSPGKTVPDLINSVENSMKILSRSVERLEICDNPSSSKDSVKQRKTCESNSSIYKKQFSSTNNNDTSINEDGAEPNKQIKLKANCELTQLINRNDVYSKPLITYQDDILNSKGAADINLLIESNCYPVCTATDNADNITDEYNKNIPPITNTGNSEIKEVSSDTQNQSQSLIKQNFTNINKSTYSNNKMTSCISLEDIGINVRPPKVHLSSYRIPKIKGLEDTKNNSRKLESYVDLKNEENREQLEPCRGQEKKCEEKKSADSRKYKEETHKNGNKGENDLNEVEPLKSKRQSEKETKNVRINCTINFDNKRELVPRAICDKFDTGANVGTIIENKCSTTASAKCLYPSQTLKPKLKTLRRKSVNFPASITKSDKNETPGSIKSTKSVMKSINLHRKMLDSNSDDNNDNKLSNKKKSSSELNKLGKTSKLKTNLESSSKAQTMSGSLSETNSKVGTKSMYVKKLTTEDVDMSNNKIYRSHKTGSIIKIPTVQECAIKLSETTNKNGDNEQLINTIKSFRMRKKSIFVDSESPKFYSTNLDQVESKSCASLNLEECNKIVKNQTEVLYVKDGNKNVGNLSSINKNLKETNPFPFKIQSISTEQSLVNSKRIDTGSDFPNNFKQLGLRFNNKEQICSGISDFTSDAIVKALRKKSIDTRKAGYLKNENSNTADTFQEQNHTLNSTVDSDVIVDADALNKFTIECQQQCKDLRNAENFNSVKAHLVETSDEKRIKIRRKSTKQSQKCSIVDSSDTVSVFKQDANMCKEKVKQYSESSSVLSPKLSKIHESSSAEVKLISLQKLFNTTPNNIGCYNISEKLDTTSPLNQHKAYKVYRKSTCLSQSFLNPSDTKLKPSHNILLGIGDASKLKNHFSSFRDFDPAVAVRQQKSIKPRGKSINKKIIVDFSSDDDEPLIKRTPVRTKEVKIPLEAMKKSKQHKRRVVKVISTSLDAPANEPNSSHLTVSPLASPNHPIFHTEVSTQSTEFVASLPMTPNQQDDRKLKEIDSKLHEIFQSPVNTAISPDASVSNQTILQPPTNEVLSNMAKNESVHFNCQNSQCSLDVGQVNQPTVSFTNTQAVYNNNEIKHISLGSAEYRFEKVSDNVINLFISRKRKRKRNN